MVQWQLGLKAPVDTPGRLVPPQRLRHNSRKRAEGAMQSIRSNAGGTTRYGELAHGA